MENLNNFLTEKLHINKNSKFSDSQPITERNSLASKGAEIEVDLDKQYVFMMYDPGSGIVMCFDCDSYQDLINEWGYIDSEAKRICNLNCGESYKDKMTGAIYTMIS